MNNAGVDLLDKIQRSKGFTDYEMSKRMGISQTSYKYLKEKAQTIRSDLLIRAQEIASEDPAPWTLNKFWNELKDEVKKTRFKRAKK